MVKFLIYVLKLLKIIRGIYLYTRKLGGEFKIKQSIKDGGTFFVEG